MKKENLHFWIGPIALLVTLLTVALLLNVLVVAPAMRRNSDTYIPDHIASLKAGLLTIHKTDGESFELPVRILDDAVTRALGPTDIGPLAMKTMILFYSFRRVQAPATYSMAGLREAVSVAVFDENGILVHVYSVEPSQVEVHVESSHRALLVTRENLFEFLHIDLGAAIGQDALRVVD